MPEATTCRWEEKTIILCTYGNCVEVWATKHSTLQWHVRETGAVYEEDIESSSQGQSHPQGGVEECCPSSRGYIEQWTNYPCVFWCRRYWSTHSNRVQIQVIKMPILMTEQLIRQGCSGSPRHNPTFCWKCLSGEYLPSLSGRKNWKKRKRNLKVGDVVLVAEQNPLLHILVKMEFSVQLLCVHNMESTKDQSLKCPCDQKNHFLFSFRFWKCVCLTRDWQFFELWFLSKGRLLWV